MTLLTPAVLHSSSLEYLTQQPVPFFKKYLFKVGLLQGVFALIIGIAMAGFYLVPAVNTIKTWGDQAFKVANFSSASIENGNLVIDIKPGIWTYSVVSDSRKQIVIAVDSVGTMNKYFWDDRYESGAIRKVYGVGFLHSGVIVKTVNGTLTIPYTRLVGSKNHTYNKEVLYKKFSTYTSTPMVFAICFLIALLCFFVGFTAGMLLHLLFLILIGGVIAILANYQQLPLLKSMKIAAGLYVVWIYFSLLFNLATLIPSFNSTFIYTVIQSVVVIALLFVGAHYVKTNKLEIVSKPGVKLKAKNDAKNG